MVLISKFFLFSDCPYLILFIGVIYSLNLEEIYFISCCFHGYFFLQVLCFSRLFILEAFLKSLVTCHILE